MTTMKTRRASRVRMRKEWRQWALPLTGKHRRSLVLHLHPRDGGHSPKPDRWTLSVTECFHKDEPESRSLELSLRCVPLAYAVFAGKASPAVLADYLEDEPGRVLGVTHRRSRWEKVPGTIGDQWGWPAKERVRESDYEVLAFVLFAMRQATDPALVRPPAA